MKKPETMVGAANAGENLKSGQFNPPSRKRRVRPPAPKMGAIMKASFDIARTSIHYRIDMLAADALADVKEAGARARDEIAVNVGWMLRSQGQIRRYRNAKGVTHAISA